MCCLKDDDNRAMVCTADDLLDWKDFPKGLKVLLIDGDSCSAAEMRSKLEEMDYIGKKLRKFPSFLFYLILLTFLQVCSWNREFVTGSMFGKFLFSSSQFWH